MEFSTNMYIDSDLPEVNLESVLLKLDSGNYSQIDPHLSNCIDSFITNQSIAFNRRYKTMASRIAMVMCSALEGYVDNNKCRFIKIVQLGVDSKFQRLGLSKLLIDYILKVATCNNWAYIIIECVNNEYLSGYLERSSQWNRLPCDKSSFYSKCS